MSAFNHGLSWVAATFDYAEKRNMKLNLDVKKWIVAAVAALGLAGTAWGQAYPTRSVALIVPFAAGGPSDALARVLAQRMSSVIGQQMVVENATGAGGTIGAGKGAQARPDG